MKTILVPVDFSKTSRNAALYAVEMGKQLKAERILLFNCYNYLSVSDPLMGYEQATTIERYKSESEEQLLKLKESLEEESGYLGLEPFTWAGFLAEGVDELINLQNVDLVVMGITGGGMLKQTLIGSNTIKVAKHISIPLLIVPLRASFVKIEEIMLACDYKKVEETIPIQPITKLLDDTKATFFVLNVTEDLGENAIQKDLEQNKLSKLFSGYNPQFFVVEATNIIDEINEFANEHEVDIIITVPKNHGWMERLLSPTHTTQLAFHTHVPLLIIHD